MVEPEDLVRLVDAGSPQLGCPPVAIDFPITGRGAPYRGSRGTGSATRLAFADHYHAPVLAGDNAIVVSMAASRVHPAIRVRAIFWGVRRRGGAAFRGSCLADRSGGGDGLTRARFIPSRKASRSGDRDVKLFQADIKHVSY
jgi:hypothetical protein